METLLQDIKYAARMLLSSRGVTAAAALSLALGIGANTAIFTFVQGVLYPPLPVPDAGRLVSLYTDDPKNPGFHANSFRNYEDLRDRTEVFSGLLTYRYMFVSFRDSQTTGEQVFAGLVSGNYFDTLGVVAAQGRTFRPDEDETLGTHPVAVIGHGFWQRRFGADPGVVNHTISINRYPFTIIGVAPEGFTGLEIGLDLDLYVPAAMYQQVLADTFWHESRRALSYSVVGRLNPGVTLEQADQELDAIAAQLDEEFPEVNKDRRVTLVPTREARINPTVRDGIAQSLAMMMVIVGMVLLVACANVANLLLARAAGRRREIAVRLAMGANRWRLIRQLLTESILLAALGGVLGLVVAVWTTSLLVRSFPETPFPIVFDFGLDGVILAFAFGVTVVTGVLCGLAPALQSSRPDMVTALKAEGLASGGRGRRFALRNVLVVAQVAVSLMLLIAAGLFIRSGQNAQNIDPGFAIGNALVMALDVGLEGYAPDEGRQFFRDLTARVGALPGVSSATVTQSVPLALGTISRTTFIESRGATDEEDGVLIQCGSIGLGYLDSMGIGIVEGRDFNEFDRRDTARVAIINEVMAERFWPGESAIGKRFWFITREDELLEVVGVAAQSKVNTLGEEPTPFIYMPHEQEYVPAMQLVVRTETEPEAFGSAVRGAIQDIDPAMPVFAMLTLADQLDFSLWPARTGATLLGAFGLLGLILASVGLYGVMSYAVSSRTREIGVRVALGAKASAVLRMVMARGVGIILVGVAIGLALAVAVSSFLSSLLYGIGATDPIAFGVTTSILLVVALLASYVPARRATRVDPVRALKAE